MINFFFQLLSFDRLKNIYEANDLNYDIKKNFKMNEYKKIVEFMSIDKKNNDKKINFILLKKIGLTTLPNKYKISINNLKALSKPIAQY